MKWELGKIWIKELQFGPDSKLDKDGTVTLDKAALIEKLMEDRRIAAVGLEIAKPGERTRIIPVKDVIEPRVKVKGEGGGFPGVTHKIAKAGSGRTHALSGMAVVTIGDIVGIQEGIIDMWGEGARYTPFSRTLNLVVDIKPVQGLTPHEHEEVVRLAGLKASAWVGALAKDCEPDELEVFEWGSIAECVRKYPELPKVVYIEMLISQGLLHDTYVYGIDAKQMLPTLFHPNEILDGAVVSGNCVAACDKITTYQHLNNSVIRELYNKHGKELNFLGVILTPELVTLEGKIRSANHAVNLALLIGAEGAIVTEEGYGNTDTDLLMICRKLEEQGIKAVLITDECAGRDGSSQPLADTTPEAKAVVSTGNVSHLISLEPADRVLGNDKAIANLSGGYDESLLADGTIRCELNAIIGSTSEIGYFNVTTKLY